VGKTILITGAGTGFGALTARALARAGHTVYAGIRDAKGRDAGQVAEAAAFATTHGVQLRTVELDVLQQESADAAVDSVLSDQGRIDVVVHNAGHLVSGPSEAFTPEEIGKVYDTNVLGTQRVNRAVLPHLRAQREGLLVWMSSSSIRGGTPLYMGPYFAAKAGMDALAVTYAGELARHNIETTIVVPGAFTSGTDHWALRGGPGDTATVQAYETLYGGMVEDVARKFAAFTPAGTDVGQVADAVVEVVDTPHGSRPFRVHIDPINDGCEEVNVLADRIRADFLHRIGIEDVLHPH
jgi:NAD(P)-dependent dehydrogenase (short-subunit alcohol dehydrogenase family)